MFSHDHRDIHFMGREKLAFAIAASRTKAPPIFRSDTGMSPGVTAMKGFAVAVRRRTADDWAELLAKFVPLEV
jgi:hypothetical protein